MATKKISELEAVTTAEDNDVLVLVDVSEGTTNKITKGNLLLGSGNQIEIDLDSATYQLVFKLKNSEGTVLSTATIDLPSENAITKIEYENGKLTLTKQSGATSQVDISGLIEGLVTESDFNGFKEALQETIQGITETLGEINTKNLEQDKKLAENYNEINNLKEQVTDAENNQLTSNATGTSIDINDSASAKNRGIGLIGNTTQESTTGVQLINITATSQSSQYGFTLTVNDDKSITINGTSTSSSYAYFRIAENLTLPAGNYTLSNGNNNAAVNSFLFLDDGNTFPKTNVSNVTLTEDTVIKPYIRIAPGATMNKETVYPMIVKGTYTAETMPAYEAYTGGIPAPNPDYEMPIKNTGDNGSVNEKVQNKNLFNKNDTDIANGYLVNGVPNGNTQYNQKVTGYIPVKAGETYIQNLANTNNEYAYYDKNKNYISGTNHSIPSTGLFNPPEGAEYLRTGFFAKQLDTFQLEEGSTVSDYVPHEEQNISLTLPEGMKLCKIGDVSDYFYKENGKWYKHEVIKKIVLTGNENWIYYTSIGEPYFFYTPDYTNIIKNKIVDNSIILCNYFQNRGKAYKPSGQGIFVNADFSGKIENGNLSVTTYDWGNDVETFKQFLREKKPEVYFAVKEPTEIEITDETLIAQLDAMQNIRTYKPVTHISSSNETPATVNITYVKDSKLATQEKITPDNRLLSDLVNDTNQTNKFVTSSEKEGWDAKYNKPNTGIPKADLSNEVKSSLNKANTAELVIGIDTNTYDSTKTYNTGDIVIQNEKIYKANQDNITGTFDSSKWDEISIYEYQKIQDEKLAENYNEINNLKQQVEDLENNQLISNATGTSIDINDSASAKNRGIGLIGRTTQESTTGKQLFDISQVQAQSGSTSNSSGKVELRDNGFKLTKLTAAGDGNGRYTGSIPCVLEAGNYIISGKLNDKSNLHIMAIFGGSKVVVISGNSIAFSLDNAVTGLQFCLRLEEEQNTYVEYSDIMIRPSTITDDTYEPFTGGQASPNPDYQQDIKNTGDNINLFDGNAPTTTRGGVTLYNNGDGSYTLNGTLTANTAFQLTTSPITLENGKTYTQSIKVVSGTFKGSVVPNFKNSNDEIQYNVFNNNSTTTTTDIMTLNSYDYVISNGTTVNCTFKVKLEEGTKATPYSPYGCGNVNEKVQNKNLFDGMFVKKYIDQSTGQPTTYEMVNYRASENFIIIKANTNYIGSRQDDTKGIAYYYYELNGSYIAHSTNSGALVYETRVFDRDVKVKVLLMNCVSSKDYTFQLEQGTTATEYQAHAEQNISFPLAEGQKLMQGDYLADDGVHHVSGETVFDGTEDMGRYRPDVSSEYFCAHISIANLKAANGVHRCNYFKEVYGSTYNQTDNSFYCMSSQYVYISIAREIIGATADTSSIECLELFKNYLATQKENGTPVILQYSLINEVVDPYTPGQQIAWEQIKALRTYKNVTHISSEDETPATVEIEYVVDTKTYIDNEIETLKNAVISLGGNV